MYHEIVRQFESLTKSFQQMGVDTSNWRLTDYSPGDGKTRYAIEQKLKSGVVDDRLAGCIIKATGKKAMLDKIRTMRDAIWIIQAERLRRKL